MTVYARSDLAHVSVSKAHGGCGRPGGHSRPVEHGAPAAIWALTCSEGCEDQLRHDPCWSVTASEIPETWDESKIREDFEKRGARDKDALMTLIMAKSVGLDPSQLPESLTRMISGTPLHIPLAGVMECAGCGHASPPGMKFCGVCGQPMSRPVTKAALDAPPVAAPSQDQGRGPVRLQDLRHDELRAACRTRGLPDAGVRKELMKRLRNAGVTNADLQRLLVAA
jgi:hypothetical protein